MTSENFQNVAFEAIDHLKVFSLEFSLIPKKVSQNLDSDHCFF